MNKIKKLLASPLLTGSLIMLIGTNSVNFLAYIYHLFFGRLLGPSLYGELAATLSLIGLLSSLFGFLGVVIVKFAATEDGEGRQRLFSWLGGIITKVAVIALVLLFLAFPLIVRILSSSPFLAIQIGPIIYFTFFIMLNSSFLQGLLEFKKIVFIGVATWVVRFVLGYLLYMAGLSLPGVVFAILVSSLIASEMAKYFLSKKGVRWVKKVYEKKDMVVRYSIPVLVMTVATGSFIALDVILARYFLPSRDSGLYAALSTLGKIIVYASAPILTVMFPLVSKSHGQGERTGKTLFLSGLATLLISTAIILVYKNFPGLAVNLLYGKSYIAVTPYLVRIGMLNLVYALDLLIVNYFLSRSKVAPSYFTVIAAVAQVIGIILFHGGIGAIINVSTFAASILFVILAVYSVANLDK
jgi:O-antigen/teichoic acid export membrane protein